jgi:hypothetical protein
MLAISCFPDDHLPRPITIVGQLKMIGIDAAILAQDKAVVLGTRSNKADGV